MRVRLLLAGCVVLTSLSALAPAAPATSAPGRGIALATPGTAQPMVFEAVAGGSVFFTTPELLEIGNIPFVTPYEKPTRVEALRYYRRIVDTFQLPIEMGQTVTAVTREGDILIAAIGRAAFVTADMVRPGAAVIDVGINRVDDPAAARGYRLVGDVDFEAVERVAGWITPVPGGVGPMTIAMLLANTLEAAERAEGRR